MIADGSADARECSAGLSSRFGGAAVLRALSAAGGEEGGAADAAFVTSGFDPAPADGVLVPGAVRRAPGLFVGVVLPVALRVGDLRAGGAATALPTGRLLVGDLRAGVFFAGAFLAGDFLAGDFFAGAFFAGAFLAGTFRAGAFLAGTVFAGALAGAGVFLAGAFAGVFLAGAFLAGAFFAAAFLPATFLPATFLPATFRAVTAFFAFPAFFATAMLDLLIHWAGGKGVGSPRSAGKHESQENVIALSGWTGAEYGTRGGFRQRIDRVLQPTGISHRRAGLEMWRERHDARACADRDASTQTERPSRHRRLRGSTSRIPAVSSSRRNDGCAIRQVS
ncbi:hypothetical protein [Dokdonella immobilis]|uniref:hypothetical protein n=1 Tax=Dokdonella immobilis TaxID=578942 RepID=UPI001FE5AF1A|nr:hypothetical protein [Dokdonella immobilis]